VRAPINCGACRHHLNFRLIDLRQIVAAAGYSRLTAVGTFGYVWRRRRRFPMAAAPTLSRDVHDCFTWP
jgi:hypothetical protein